MNPRTILACLATAFLVAVGLNLAAPPSSGQFIKSAQSLEKWWPPHPRNAVLLDQRIQGVFNNIPGGGEASPYTVPSDRWLVLTFNHGWDGDFDLYEDAGGVLTFRSSTGHNWPGGPEGMVFAPGSRVVFFNKDSAVHHLGDYRLSGFLAPL